MLVALPQGCDTTVGGDGPDVPGDSLAVDCEPIIRDSNQFTLAVKNLSDVYIDSLSFDLLDSASPSNKSWYLDLAPGKRTCPQAIDREYTRHGTSVPRSWAWYHVSPFGWPWIYDQPLRPFDLQAADYVYELRINRVTEIYSRTIHLIVEDIDEPDLLVRISNVMGAAAYDVRVYFPDTLIRIPVLDPGESTDYIALDSVYRYAGMEYVVGTDTVESIPIDYVGERLRYSGRFRLQVDTIRVPTLYEVGQPVLDVR